MVDIIIAALTALFIAFLVMWDIVLFREIKGTKNDK